MVQCPADGSIAHDHGSILLRSSISSLLIFIRCVSREAGCNVEYILNHPRGSIITVRVRCETGVHRSHTSAAPIVPLAGPFFRRSILVRQSSAKPAALVYYKRRDCSIQSLQQRTFKLHFFLSLSLTGDCEGRE